MDTIVRPGFRQSLLAEKELRVNGFPKNPMLKRLWPIKARQESCRSARKALAAATRIGEVKDIHDKAIAMKDYAFKACDCELTFWAVEIRERAVLRLGELTDEQPKAKGTRGTGRPKIGGVKKPRLKKRKP